MSIFRSRTEIILPDTIPGSIVVSETGWANYFHGTPLNAEELEEVSTGKMPSLVVDYVDGFGIMLRLQPESRQEAPFDDQPTALFELRIDEETADSLATALENVVQILRKQRGARAAAADQRKTA